MADFLRTLSLIKGDNPAIYTKDRQFFPEPAPQRACHVLAPQH